MHFAELGRKHTAQLAVMQAAYASGMNISSTRHMRRRANLEILVKENGGPSSLALLVDTPKSHISALMAGSRGIGDQLAAKLERKCEKHLGWMDEDHEGAKTAPVARQSVQSLTVSQVATELAISLGGLPEEDRSLIAQHVSYLIKNGPAERHAAALDALTSVKLQLQPAHTPDGGSSSHDLADRTPYGSGADTQEAAPIQETEIGIWHSKEAAPVRRPRHEVEIDLDSPAQAPGVKRRKA